MHQNAKCTAIDGGDARQDVASEYGIEAELSRREVAVNSIISADPQLFCRNPSNIAASQHDSLMLSLSTLLP
jgi:hypothetical protein